MPSQATQGVAAVAAAAAAASTSEAPPPTAMWAESEEPAWKRNEEFDFGIVRYHLEKMHTLLYIFEVYILETTAFPVQKNIIRAMYFFGKGILLLKRKKSLLKNARLFQYQDHDEEDVVEVEHLVVRTPVAADA